MPGSAAHIRDFTWAAQDYRRQEGCNNIRLGSRHVDIYNIAYCKFPDHFVLGPFFALTPSREFTHMFLFP